jgi:hypothetical protein
MDMMLYSKKVCGASARAQAASDDDRHADDSRKMLRKYRGGRYISKWHEHFHFYSKLTSTLHSSRLTSSSAPHKSTKGYSNQRRLNLVYFF